ncbi:MAG TPA: single-stranded-DNA-specific exonuclease RecJ [Oscillatoriaceae cyanobacterium M7585_C2015_266]|nr:single-stranded-DNA-specific exonuclease RecJ [Oscillatoriaceae cyanobacterium SKYGB_i_bin93]HIK26803.1 single-stranded-DNA-specific exonuclease RecJ [Oscillatoriaceae cyanobacterium M7585_C2015_266]
MIDSTSQPYPQPHRLPNQRWHIFPQKPELAKHLADVTGLPPILAQVIINRGIETPSQAIEFLNLDSQTLPSPLDEFPDLEISIKLLEEAIANQDKIAICGDYDADGMTSTALLLRALRWLGAKADYVIPSRMKEGYGINHRIVEEFHSEGVKLILTVDNGIAAFEPIKKARQLGLKVIVTDHHDIPEKLPPANAILNPKLIHKDSPYRGIAGVGVAYILAICLAQKFNKSEALIAPFLELVTLGTIADLAPLTGVNRHWVKKGLQLLPQSQLAGVQALIQVAGLNAESSSNKALKPEDIGFRLGPRINAVGRIGEPQIIIELLTTDDMEVALERAKQCEEINQRRQQLCEEIEKEAIAWVESSKINLYDERVLIIVQPNWHHGVIGIVASRLVERYGVPVFIGTYENNNQIRGSARGIPEFHVFEALQLCDDLLGKYGGHKAAGGFSLSAENLEAFRDRLIKFANSCLEIWHLKPLIEIDAQAEFNQINLHLYQKINLLQPCGIENKPPIFWTPNVRVIDQNIIKNKHLKVTLEQTIGKHLVTLEAIAWRWSKYYPLPSHLDVAYQLKENTWNGTTTIELELVGIRLPQNNEGSSTPTLQPATIQSSLHKTSFSIVNSPTLFYPEPPGIKKIPEWFDCRYINGLLSKLRGRVLLYGADKKSLKLSSDIQCQIEYDRPPSICDTFILYTLPPSRTHLQWLLAVGQPRQVYVCNQMPSIPGTQQLFSRLQAHLQKFPNQPLNLLMLGQQWWVAPCTLVAALREMGYPCPDFPNTYPIEQELLRLQGWYLYPAARLSQLNWR